ncbi:MAG TPA: carboxypeptidase-like regulatory domain-containing protein, partial [Nitrospira sp.]|nr:carboxypeptidase-like regulatory domain-containing protein [Nitrospira sp.]
MYPVVRCALDTMFVMVVTTTALGMFSVVYAQNGEQAQTIKGVVQNQDLRRVPQAVIEVRSQDGEIISSAVSNDAGEFKITVPEGGTYSVSAVQETYRSEYAVVTIGKERPAPVTLTLALTKEIALEIVSPL